MGHTLANNMTLFVFPVLSYLSQIAAVLPIIFLFARFSKELKVLSVYLVLALIVDTLQLILAMQHLDNRWTSQYFLPIQFILLVIVYYLWTNTSNDQWLWTSFLCLFTLAYVISVICLHPLPRWFAYVKPGTAILIVLLSCSILVKLVKQVSAPMAIQPIFWVASANVIYFAGTAVLYSLSMEVFQSPVQIMRLAWSTQAVINVFANLLYLRGFLCYRQQ
jgi:hypothetical protein